ncbi:MAG: HAD family phosphatase [Planctomycetota bacterium]
MPIEFVYFDLGNLLVSFDPRIACQNVAELLSVSAGDAHSAIYDTGLQYRYETGELESDAFTALLCCELAVDPVDPMELLDAVSDMFCPITPMRDILDRVRQRGMGVGLLSNTCFAHWNWISRQQYPETTFAFDATILSYEVGAMKPASKIYQAAESAVAIPASHIAFLDDREENVKAASDRGWQARQCFGGEEAIAALVDLGVLDDADLLGDA